MESEKVSVNISNDKISKIDLLVEEGLVANRSSFINEAIDLLLSKNDYIINKIIDSINETISPNQWFFGLQSINEDYLLKYKNNNVKLSLSGFGSLYISNNISVELLEETVEKISKKIKIHANNEQLNALKDKIK